MNLSSFTTGTIFEALFISFVSCLIITFLSTKFAVQTKLLDIPASQPHKVHQKPVPISGGLAFFVTLWLCSMLMRHDLSSPIIKLLIAATIIFIFGLWDDYSPLKPYQKIIGQTVASSVLIAFGTQAQIVESFPLPFQLNPYLVKSIDIGITLFWLLFITNAFNLIDSMDGLMVGIASWTIGFFILAAIDSKQWPLAFFCAIMLGSCILLTFFNAHPAFIFFGDSGAQTIGFLLAAIAILYNPPERLQSNTWFMPILMLGIPIFDTVLVVLSRRRRGLHFYSSGTDHTYHRLVKLGLSSVQAVQIMLLAAFALEILAFLAISQTPLRANIIFGIVLIFGILGIVFFESEKVWKKENSNQNTDQRQ
ncbi:MAG: undecaprenyl/decaprenyl-phosphate alpha-N-acetylglucosaminyl 1-phosphate transferase [Flexilinea flocculi]|jgi:UDP-GlcNAc:undecaprenyl-phosphate GlcNAc-1-phosphate transferase|nr:undecaprenyl/decaprenyl-phosphate alpha-N-acetylglucosaminyl 1-phosphate transferase [Flexilinea flocculi]